MAEIEKKEQQNASFAANYIDETIKADSDSRVKAFVKKFLKRKTAVLGLIIILLLVVIAIIGPSIAPYDYNEYDYMNVLTGPTPEHIFGTDHYGRDIFSRMLVGARLTLGVSLSAVVIGAALGTVLGLMAGYYGGVIEMLVMRGSDVLFSFPDILLAIAIVAILGPGIINVLIAVMVFTVPSFARIMRSATLAVKSSLYVEVAKSLGCNKIALGHHYDDVIETILMGMLYGAQVQTMMPKLHSTNFEGMQLIRPMYLIREADIKHWRDYNDLHFIQCACKFTDTCTTCRTDGTSVSKRMEIKNLIAELKKVNPHIESNIFRSVENVNLHTVIAYKKDGVKHSFLEGYDD